ncbi:alpha/beta hydrolase [Streptomyces sp. NPDC087440]|uniref:alpha/beta hydrolase n=1 Tax=Streptomyces sp. NPDC087440 TaxID=3365790 RepID=UPI003830E515
MSHSIPDRFEPPTGTGTGRVALVVPGAGYTPARPLLHYARAVLLQHGWTVRELWWQLPDGIRELTADEQVAWAEEQVARAVDAEDGGCGLVVGKSLASLTTGLVADRGIPAVWLTPLLHLPLVSRNLARATAPTLLVGGTGDGSWVPRAARELPHDILELPLADHGLEVPGDALASVRLLGEVVGELGRFAGKLAQVP